MRPTCRISTTSYRILVLFDISTRFSISAFMANSHESRSFFLQGPVGRLEAILWIPDHPRKFTLVAVLCHPHPLFGGTLHNKVIYQAAKTLDALGVPVLRFNFRGAGLSTGLHDKGRGEVGDVQAAVDFLALEFPDVPLLLGGFSFGSWVGLKIGCSDPRVIELLGIGVPVDSSDFTYLWSCAKPKLFLHGSEDEHGARSKVEDLVANLPGENQLTFIPQADHFFRGHLDEFDAALAQWLLARHPELRATQQSE